MIRNISVNKKFAILLLVGFLGMASLYGAARYTITTTSIGSPAYDGIVKSKDLLADILPPPLFVVESYLGMLELTRADGAGAIEKKLASIQEQRKQFDGSLRRWTSELPDGRIKNQLVKEVCELGAQVYASFESDLVPAARAGDKARMNSVLSGKIAPLFAKHREAVAKLATSLDEYAKSAEKAGGNAVTTGLTFFTMFFGGAVAAVLLFGLFLARDMTSALKRCGAFAEQVAGGNLDVQLAMTRTDDFGSLGASLRHMLEELKKKIAQADEHALIAEQEVQKAQQATREAHEAEIRAESAKSEGMLQAAHRIEGVVDVVSGASDALAAQIEQSSRGAQEQSQRMGETAAAMEEMNATVLEVAKSASLAAQTSDEAKIQAEEGADVVDKAVRGISQVKTQADGLRSDMDALGKQAEGIGRVMNVISDIADQTNLLALNAAIEAARAGDAGRGFAVVADEVRKLAEKTMTATKEVGDAIHGIQQGARTNIENVEKSARTIEEATALAQKSGESLQRIVTLVEQASDQVRSIAAASEEQAAASEEITRHIEDVNRISAETSDAMGQSARAVEELAEQAQTMRALIAEMKTGSSEANVALVAGTGRTASSGGSGSRALGGSGRPKALR